FLTTERYIPHDQKVYTFYGKLLSFVCALRKVAFNSSRYVALKTVPALR
ncbi:hypothetical protein HMPREF3185_01023, partial [Porphyromonas somerae]